MTRQTLPRAAFTGKGGVSCESPLACSAGYRVLASGGNAIDAFVTISLVLAVVVPHLGGLGGDLFAIVRTGDGKIRVLNGSGPSPSRLSRDLVLESYESMPERGPLTITVPGMLLALYELWKKYGSIEWRSLVEPAISLARNGFPAHRSLHRSLHAHRELLSSDPGSKAIFAERIPSSPSDIFRYRGLARLLEDVAEDPTVLYRGWPAEAIEEYVNDRGGVLDSRDLSSYKPEWEDPLRLEINGWIVYEMPPNTQGVTTLHILSLLDWETLPRDTVALATHIIRASAPSYAFRDRYLGDKRYMDLNVSELLSPSVISGLRSGMPDGLCQPSTGSSAVNHDTTALLAADSNGMIVVGVQSLFYHWGSGLTVPEIEVTLNNRARGFTLDPGLPNTLGPSKKPLHTLSALIALSGDRIIALATSGGHYRPQQHAMMLSRVIRHGLTISESIAEPRILWKPGTCQIIADTPEAFTLNALGYDVLQSRTGVAVGLDYHGRIYEIAADPGGEGAPYILI